MLIIKQILENQLSGLLLKIEGNEVWVKLIGTFNAYNVLAIYGTAVELGMDSLETLRLLSELESVSKIHIVLLQISRLLIMLIP
jgi:UDP-N-acetylmuramoyl-L-alanyl-D-glutamate--2,6-diaminopimelate ligase